MMIIVIIAGMIKERKRERRVALVRTCWALGRTNRSIGTVVSEGCISTIQWGDQIRIIAIPASRAWVRMWRTGPRRAIVPLRTISRSCTIPSQAEITSCADSTIIYLVITGTTTEGPRRAINVIAITRSSKAVMAC